VSLAQRATFAVVGGLLASFGQVGFTPCSWFAAPLLFAALVGADVRTAFLVGALHGACDALDCAGAAGFGGIALVLIFGGAAANRAVVAVAVAVAQRRAPPLLRPLAAAVAFVVVDTIGARLQGGFHTPLSLGSSQVDIPVLAQPASVVGERGVTFVVVLIGALCLEALRVRTRASRLVVVVAVVAWVGAGVALRARLPTAATTIRVASIQGAVPASVHELAQYDENAARAIEGLFVSATRDAVRGGARLVIWPEGSVRSGGVEHVAFRERLRSLARELGVALIVGADIPLDATTRANGALVVDADGDVDVVTKLGLLPVLETEYRRADARHVVDVAGARIGVLICAESLSPAPATELAAAGAQALVVVVNDAGLGLSKMEHIHAGRARMRAIENRLAVVHAGQWARTLVANPLGDVVTRNAQSGFTTVSFDLPLARAAGR
jgi:apolipoprotein N-acyltransferase